MAFSTDNIEKVCHEEQLRIWADDNIMAALAMGGYLRDLDYSEGVELQEMLMREIKSVVEMAFDHPARQNVEEMLQDRNVVHLNMLGGSIARLSDGQVKHLYPHLFQ